MLRQDYMSIPRMNFGPKDFITNEKHLTVITGVEKEDPRLDQPTKIEVNSDGSIKRNTFACVKCHDLKQKCRPSDMNDIYRHPCVRCLRNNDTCIFDLSKRKRKRRKGTRSPGDKSRDNGKRSKRNSDANSIEEYSESNNYTLESAGQQQPIPSTGSWQGVSSLWNNTTTNTTTPAKPKLFDKQIDNQPLMPMNISLQNTPATTINNILSPEQPLLNTLSLETKNSSSAVPIINDDSMLNSISGSNDSSNNNMSLSMNLSPGNNPSNNNISTSPGSHIILNGSVPGMQQPLDKMNAAPSMTPTIQFGFNDQINQYQGKINDNNNNNNNSNNKALNNNDDNNINNVPNNYSNSVINNNLPVLPKSRHHHLNRMAYSFKKQLQSLVYHQKEKIQLITRLLDQSAKEWQIMIDKADLLPVAGDPVSAGIISREEAQLRLNRFSSDITFFAGLSFINFSNNTDVDIMRAQKPMLFAVVMSCSTVLMKAEETTQMTSMRLDTFVLKLLTTNIFKRRVDAVQLVQSLLILCLWYNFLEWPSRSKYHFFNYVCCVVSREFHNNPNPGRVFNLFPDREPKPHHSLEVNRLILLVYITALNVCIFLRQPLHTPYNSYIDSAYQQSLKDSTMPITDSHKADSIILPIFTSLCHILEDIHRKLHEITNEDELFQYDSEKLVASFHSKLDDLYLKIPPTRPRVIAYFFSIKAYLYQFVLEDYIKKNMEFLKGGNPVPEHISKAFSDCFDCCVLCLENFIKLDSKLIASLPLFHSSRMVYTVGLILLKIRYKVITSASFHHLLHKTDNAVPLVKKVAEALENCSRLYPYNYPLYKLQYVIALFCQTYAKRVIEASERQANNSEATSNIQFNTQLLRNENASRSNSGPTGSEEVPASINKILSRNNSNPTGEDSNTPINNAMESGILGARFKPEINESVNNNNVRSESNGNNVVNSVESQTIKSSPSSSIHNINDYLTDMDSLMWGVNTLNDEFWSDLFMTGT
ncbi:hypothetical protein RNJ44_04485 [Nakaseomyces bracarensis]|uniref:Zn(2)-C6 fungal-type domain-containing protein n=1 Tax=Nakaseomyces bracarensis TaxID=273131 RepID=A0ABR4NV12_9SACH